MKKLMVVLLTLFLSLSVFGESVEKQGEEANKPTVMRKSADTLFQKLKGFSLEIRRKMDERFEAWGLGISRPIYADLQSDSVFNVTMKNEGEAIVYVVEIPFFTEQKISAVVKNQTLYLSTKVTRVSQNEKVDQNQLRTLKKYYSKAIRLPAEVVASSMTYKREKDKLYVTFQKRG